ncbi:hypothetical protein HD806DRAFT_552425 [Xylariaceae sp. AK1471]|nr:hypothetical protein HD806DRAFT_552425 [Xylariaceae sp. AK1471]
MSVPATHNLPAFSEDAKRQITEFVGKRLAPFGVKITPEEVENRIKFGYTCVSFDFRMQVVPIHPVHWTFDKPRVLLLSIDAWEPSKTIWREFYEDMCSSGIPMINDAIVEFRCKMGNTGNMMNDMMRKHGKGYSEYHVFGPDKHGFLGERGEGRSDTLNKEMIEGRVEQLLKQFKEETDGVKKAWLRDTLGQLNRTLQSQKSEMNMHEKSSAQ